MIFRTNFEGGDIYFDKYLQRPLSIVFIMLKKLPLNFGTNYEERSAIITL